MIVAVAGDRAYIMIGASLANIGDKLVLGTAPGAKEAIAFATVTGVKTTKAYGAYIPAIAKPFMVADGVLVPL